MVTLLVEPFHLFSFYGGNWRTDAQSCLYDVLSMNVSLVFHPVRGRSVYIHKICFKLCSLKWGSLTMSYAYSYWLLGIWECLFIFHISYFTWNSIFSHNAVDFSVKCLSVCQRLLLGCTPQDCKPYSCPASRFKKGLSQRQRHQWLNG